MRSKFVNGAALQSALRELKNVALSRNLWLTFGAVVLLFAFTGPFGTLEEMRFLPRLGYWLILHGLAWSVALLFCVLGNALLETLITSMFWRILTGSACAAFPIGLIIRAMDHAWSGAAMTAGGIASSIFVAAPLCIIFCVISYMTMSSGRAAELFQPQTADASTTTIGTAAAPISETPPLLRRLKPEIRGTLQHLAVEDHYTLVTTSRGKELILMRFSDALAETGATRGLKVHRSHWVADDFVAGLNRADGKLTLLLADGSEIPVSRTYAAEVRMRFG